MTTEASKDELNTTGGHIDLAEAQDAHESYQQTHKALKEALSEQTLLREKLRVLEARNKPAKFGKPIIVHSISSTRGKISDEEATPERILFELTKATSLLENAKRAAESSANELNELEENTEEFVRKAQIEMDESIFKNALRHKNELQYEQQMFQQEIQRWNHERSELLSEAEKYSIISQDALHKSAIIREQVESQRKKIQKLATELRTNLSHSKELREKLDENKRKVALIQNLIIEIDANSTKTDQLEKTVAEQRAILKAVRISEQAQSILDDNEDQIKELQTAKHNAKLQLIEAKKEQKLASIQEKHALQRVAEEEKKFREAQSRMFVLEADIREMKEEYTKQRQSAITEGIKNVDLQVKLKGERIDAAQRFIIENCGKIHRVERVQTTLMRVKNKLQNRPSTAIASQATTIKVTKSPSMRKKEATTPRRRVVFS
ncbi:hypothetical protein TRFO_31318 [Tritrichomonas foetus]|uniref:Uncharacterized protein n=1 Tax=Tritrichomonas foetus TaxID=1144522 RepID=A0A1J4JSL3_9EUKA|nr:hypothetical protein TRFO_31318 [Tritrichomonas foetus]|eukprot:OHT01754.1 hypothetical protein TRFO_31318 [Tritrichomonas foetus]